jgi:ABC-type nitrate/sulfonate/bicarbonate transport system substrate-binding protein
MGRAQRVTLCLAVAGAIFLAACSSSGGSKSSAKSGSLTKFQIASFSGEIYGLDAVAQDQGFFKKHGLDVTSVSPSAGGGAANTLFLAGSVQGWAGNPQVILSDVAKGEKVSFAGALESWIPYQIQVPASSSLAKLRTASFADRMKALEGKKVGLTGVGALVYYDFQTALKIAGVDPKSVTVLGIGPPSNAIGQFNGGRLDAYITYSRSDALIMADQAKTVSYADLSVGDAPAELRAFSTFAFPVLSSYAASHPDLVSAYISAEKDAFAWMKANVPAAAKIVAQATYSGKYESQVEQGLTQAFATPQSADFKYNPDTFNGEVKVLAQIGLLPSGAPNDPTFAYKNLVLSSAQP